MSKKLNDQIYGNDMKNLQTITSKEAINLIVRGKGA